MKDLEFHISKENDSRAEKILTNFDAAAGYAIGRAASTGDTMVIDVVTWSRAAARAWGGEHAVEVYEEDPDASVHERIVIKAESLGHVR